MSYERRMLLPDTTGRCTANKSTCRKCDYYYVKGDDRSPGAVCPRCGSERRCRRQAMLGMNVCRTHGGAAVKAARARGVPSEIGRYSRYLPSNLASRYATALRDPEFLSLKEEISLAQTRIADLLEKLARTPTLENLRRLRDTVRAFREGNTDAEDLCAVVEKVIESAENDREVWAQTGEFMDLRRKLVQAETQRLKDMNMILTVDEANALLIRLRAIVSRHLRPGITITHDLLANIQQELVELQYRRSPTGNTRQEVPPGQPDESG